MTYTADNCHMPYSPILQPDSTVPPQIPPVLASGVDPVLEPNSLGVLEVDRLFGQLRHTTTQIGASVLYRSLVQPLTEPAQVNAKQQALRELDDNPTLRQSLEALLTDVASLEPDLYNLLYATFVGLMSKPAHALEQDGYGYAAYIRSARLIKHLLEDVEALPAVSSPYLQTLLQTLRSFSRSRSHALLNGPVYRSEQQVMTGAEKPWYVPAIRFRPSLFKPVALLLGAAALMLAMTFIPLVLDLAAAIAPGLWLFLLPIGLAYVPLVGSFDRDGVIYPIRLYLRKAPELAMLLDAVGQLDELVSFLRYREHFGHACCLPTILSASQHQLQLTGVRNPVLAKGNPAYIGNDIHLDQQRLTFITGPNSGGKTAFCKTLAQTQLLAQIGCFVPAETAAMTLADRIYYQVPETSHLDDGEGRFGTELKRTKAMFMAASARSLIIMDELSEGTTHEEKIAISRSILDGFSQKACSTLLITHNHELVDDFQKRQQGQARQVEFANELPTYRLIPGISRVSHAERIARKIGFSSEDIARHLKG